MRCTKRSWTEAQKKQVAARSKWRCGRCGRLLESTYEIDHIRPLWEGGSDCIHTNACSLCAGCHRQKTQDESIRRTDTHRKQAQAAHEKKVSAREEELRVGMNMPVAGGKNAGITECLFCGCNHYAIFGHTQCEAADASVEQTLDREFKRVRRTRALGVRKQQANAAHPFERFSYISDRTVNQGRLGQQRRFETATVFQR